MFDNIRSTVEPAAFGTWKKKMTGFSLEPSFINGFGDGDLEGTNTGMGSKNSSTTLEDDDIGACETTMKHARNTNRRNIVLMLQVF